MADEHKSVTDLQNQEAEAKREAFFKQVNEVSKTKGLNDNQDSPLQHDMDDSQADSQQLAALKAELEKTKKKNELLNSRLEDVKAQEDSKAAAADKTAVTDIIAGIPAFFTKSYDFKVVGSDDIKFDIKMRPATLIDSSKVASTVKDLSNSIGGYVSNEIAFALESVAALKVVGIDYPKELIDIDKLYRTDILTQVYSDYIDWMDTFRQRQKF